MPKSITVNPRAPSVAVTEMPRRTEQPGLSEVSDQSADCAVIELPPNRDELAANLRAINRQSFLMICELHRGLLVNLVNVPRRILVASENLVRPKDIADCSNLWSEAMVLYSEALTDSREQILAATRSHGLAELGQTASDEIKSIENLVPFFLRAVAQTSEGHRELASTATKLSSAARTLDKILTDLLVTVEHAIQRASGHNATDRPGSPKQTP